MNEISNQITIRELTSRYIKVKSLIEVALDELNVLGQELMVYNSTTNPPNTPQKDAQ